MKTGAPADAKVGNVAAKQGTPTKKHPASTKIYVNRLTRNVKKEHLEEIFGTFGPVKSIDLPTSSTHPEFSRGYAYVEMETGEQAEEAVQHMDGGQIDGQEIRCQLYIERPARHGGEGRGAKEHGGVEGGRRGADERGRRGTEERGHKGAEERGHRGAEEKGHKGAEERGHRGPDESGHKVAEESGHKGAEERGHKGAEERGHKGTEGTERKGTDEKEHARRREREDQEHARQSNRDRDTAPTQPRCLAC